MGRIVVIGDYFIDENVVVTESRRPTASRPGRRHLKVTSAAPMTFCGAARLVRHLVASGEQDVFGLGWWAPRDTRRLRKWLVPNAPDRDPFHLTSSPRHSGPPQPSPFNPWLVSLAACLESAEEREKYTTPRVRRTYVEGPAAGGVKQLVIDARIDAMREDAAKPKLNLSLLSAAMERKVDVESETEQLRRRLIDAGFKKDSVETALAALTATTCERGNFAPLGAVDAVVIADFRHGGASRDVVAQVARVLRPGAVAALPDAPPRVLTEAEGSESGRKSASGSEDTAASGGAASGGGSLGPKVFLYTKEWRPPPGAGSSRPFARIHTVVLPSDAVRLWWERGEMPGPLTKDVGADAPVTLMHPRAWFCKLPNDGPKRPSYEAQMWLRAVQRDSRAEWVIALPPGGLVALDARDPKSFRLFFHAPESGDYVHERVAGRSSAFLAHWVRVALGSALLDDEAQIKTAFSDALFAGNQDAAYEADMLRMARREADDALQKRSLAREAERTPAAGVSASPTSGEGVEHALNQQTGRGAPWIDCLSTAGYHDRLDFDPRKSTELHVWRASPDVPGYAEVVPARRREIGRLLRLLDRYARHPHAPVSALVVAPPGSGKTFLMQRIAAFLDVRLVTIDLTLDNSEAKLEARLAAIEAELSDRTDADKRRIVFVDEVNARTETGQPSYGMFLTKLLDRKLRFHGMESSLHPLAWVFAGTDHLVDERGWKEIYEWLEPPAGGAGAQGNTEGSAAKDAPKVGSAATSTSITGPSPERSLELLWRTRERRGLPPTMREPGAGTPRNSWSEYAATKAPDFVSRLDLRSVTLNLTTEKPPPEADTQESNPGTSTPWAHWEGVNRCYVLAALAAGAFNRLEEVERRLLVAVYKGTPTNRDLKNAVAAASADAGGRQLRYEGMPDWFREQCPAPAAAATESHPNSEPVWVNLKRQPDQSARSLRGQVT